MIPPEKSSTLPTPHFSLQAGLIPRNERVARTGAIGPGGALTALAERHPEQLWALTDNLRQNDPAEAGSSVQFTRRVGTGG